MGSAVVACLLLLFVKLVFSRLFLAFTQDSQEPPPVDLSIPFISPILRMGWAGFAYYTKHRLEGTILLKLCLESTDRLLASHLPIYTIRLPGIRLYVVNSTSLVSAVQHHPRIFSFSPILARVATNLIGASEPGARILADDEENHGFVRRFHDFNHASLASGPGLDALRTKIWRSISLSHSRKAIDSAPGCTRMYEWISREVTMVTTDAVYGASQNPFRDPAIRVARREYQSGMTRLMTGFIPSIVSKRPLCARKTLVHSFEKYYSDRGYQNEEASPYIRDQYRIFSESGLSEADIAKTQAAFSIALLANTLSAAFWCVYHIFSDNNILQDCRGELHAALQQNGARDGDDGLGDRLPLDLMLTMERSCPILLSTFKETMRTHSMGTAVSQVVKDQMIDNRYLLRKGALVLIPAVVQHSDESIWSEDVNEFDHRRFIQETKEKSGSSANSKSRPSWNPAAYRVFGGGWNLCPGRHLVTSIVLGFVASVILNFDILPCSGHWDQPTVRNSNLSVMINEPDEDLNVELRYRKDEEVAAAACRP
ncbi:cytochrome P450 [Aspergillus granulosus]|uniref:Cytochrome P450 n=1 Tax=Aspergillus granulosus TaxID=176169 RepID=A0ABR4HVH6_9EURO